MKRIFLLAFLLGIVFVTGNGQTNKTLTDPLLVGPSKFKLLATNVSYRGDDCAPTSDKNDEVYSDSSEVIRVGDNAYYEAHHFSKDDRREGLVAENFAAKTCHVYRMFGLAEGAGWFKPKEDSGRPDATRGLFRVGNSLWMGSNGIGVAVFDLKQKTWSRFDVKFSAVEGDHVGVDYADKDYVFVSRGEFPGASLHVYSVKQNRWLGLKAVSTELVHEFGYTTELVQIGIDHRPFAKEKYLPLDWTLMYPQISLSNHGKSYLIERKFSESKTAFEISKSQLDQIFKRNP